MSLFKRLFGGQASPAALPAAPAETAEALKNRGNEQYAKGNLEQAAAFYREAIGLDPGHAQACNNLGMTLTALGKPAEAVVPLGRALAIAPDLAPAHFNLGNALQSLGQIEDAVASFRRAVELDPQFSDAHFNLGVALQARGQVEEAVASFRRAVQLAPELADAHCNLGNALERLGQTEAALGSYRRAIELQPDLAMAHNNLGNALCFLGRIEEGMAHFRRALQIQPDFADAFSNLLFMHNYLPGIPASTMLAGARSYGQAMAARARPYTTWPATADAARRLRVGLVSGDLNEHPVGFFLESVLGELSRRPYELMAYATQRKEDALSRRMRPFLAAWKSAADLDDEAFARTVHDDRIDILIDLSGHTAHNRLPVFAWKPAPLQVTWLGYFATTGLAEMDYLLADPWTLPESEEAHFTESVWRLPETRLCFTPPGIDVPVSPLPAQTNGYITFGCFNNLAKMNDAVVALWARLLARMPDSRLMLKAFQLNQPAQRQQVQERFVAQGVGPERLILEAPGRRAEYLAAYRSIDIALDPFPFPGGTTSVEALWMGIPVLTLAGERMISRQSMGLLMNAGLPEWIARDADDYVARALSHSADLAQLAALRQGLRQRILDSPLFDAPRFAGHLDDALRRMWERRVAGRTAL